MPGPGLAGVVHASPGLWGLYRRPRRIALSTHRVVLLETRSPLSAQPEKLADDQDQEDRERGCQEHPETEQHISSRSTQHSGSNSAWTQDESGSPCVSPMDSRPMRTTVWRPGYRYAIRRADCEALQRDPQLGRP